jgi:hypothetical protein
MNEAWTLAIEALSWVELWRVSEDSALRRAIIQLGVKESEIVDEAKRLVFEVLKRRNSLDYLINIVLAPNHLNLLEVGVQSFMRLYTYMIRYGGISFLEAHKLAEHTRS